MTGRGWVGVAEDGACGVEGWWGRRGLEGRYGCIAEGATHGGRKESRRKEGKQGDEGCWWVPSVERGCFCFRWWNAPPLVLSQLTRHTERKTQRHWVRQSGVKRKVSLAGLHQQTGCNTVMSWKERVKSYVDMHAGNHVIWNTSVHCRFNWSVVFIK